MSGAFSKKHSFCIICTKIAMKFWGFTLFKFDDKFDTILRYRSTLIKR